MRVPWRVRLVALGAALATLGSLRDVLVGYETLATYLEHLLIALVVLYVGVSVVAAVVAWYRLANLVDRRQRGSGG
jgi:hypothetical protein